MPASTNRALVPNLVALSQQLQISKVAVIIVFHTLVHVSLKIRFHMAHLSPAL